MEESGLGSCSYLTASRNPGNILGRTPLLSKVRRPLLVEFRLLEMFQGTRISFILTDGDLSSPRYTV